jgi:hypothetical protein
MTLENATRADVARCRELTANTVTFDLGLVDSAAVVTAETEADVAGLTG